MTIGIVAALPSEAAMFARLRPGSHLTLSGGHRLALSGIGAERAAATARALVTDGIGGLVSWGCAAGLDPALPAGTVTIPKIVVRADGRRLTTDENWRNRIAASLGASSNPVSSLSLAETVSVLGSVKDKEKLRQQTGAVAADMETGAIAAVAKQYRIPMIAIRAVADDAYTNLPAAAQAAVTAEGKLALRAMLRALKNSRAGWHAELRGLKQAAAGYRSAQRALKAVQPILLDNHS